MFSVMDLARKKQQISAAALSAETGPYDHAAMRRWVGKDVDLIKTSMKSSTAFDGESKSNEGDPCPV